MAARGRYVTTEREQAFLDTIENPKYDRQIINGLRPFFDDPKIVKVLHGADHDIEWLQRDLGIYVVNMFDTGQASRVLQMKSFGLAHLLQHYCGVLTDKKYQLADWRVRPLGSEMMKYAREDTHYLLYIYDCIRKDLIEQGAKQNQQMLKNTPPVAETASA